MTITQSAGTEERSPGNTLLLAELEALPLGSRVRDKNGNVHVRINEDFHWAREDARELRNGSRYLNGTFGPIVLVSRPDTPETTTLTAHDLEQLPIGSAVHFAGDEHNWHKVEPVDGKCWEWRNRSNPGRGEAPGWSSESLANSYPQHYPRLGALTLVSRPAVPAPSPAVDNGEAVAPHTVAVGDVITQADSQRIPLGTIVVDKDGDTYVREDSGDLRDRRWKRLTAHGDPANYPISLVPTFAPYKVQSLPGNPVTSTETISARAGNARISSTDTISVDDFVRVVQDGMSRSEVTRAQVEQTFRDLGVPLSRLDGVPASTEHRATIHIEVPVVFAAPATEQVDRAWIERRVNLDRLKQSAARLVPHIGKADLAETLSGLRVELDSAHVTLIGVSRV